jgi:3-hydroxybutyryl-CoA dehydrogenase
VNIEQIGVVGGGTAGRGIAWALSAAGVEVVLVEASGRLLEASLDALRDSLDREIARWAITESERDAILARISGTTDLEEVSPFSVIIEAVTEEFKTKAMLLQQLDTICLPEAVFLCNSSTLNVSDLAGVLPKARRDRLAGLHFLHPVNRVPVVELIRGRETSERAVAAARSVAELLDKEVVEVEESPGYVTTRLTLVIINEAIQALMEGVATRDSIDRAMKLRFGWTHGPLALADEIGLDSCLRALTNLSKEMGLPQYRPCPLLRRMVNRGLLGEKSGRGFYRYDERGRRVENAEEDLSLPRLETVLGGEE